MPPQRLELDRPGALAKAAEDAAARTSRRSSAAHCLREHLYVDKRRTAGSGNRSKDDKAMTALYDKLNAAYARDCGPDFERSMEDFVTSWRAEAANAAQYDAGTAWRHQWLAAEASAAAGPAEGGSAAAAAGSEEGVDAAGGASGTHGGAHQASSSSFRRTPTMQLLIRSTTHIFSKVRGGGSILTRHRTGEEMVEVLKEPPFSHKISLAQVYRYRAKEMDAYEQGFGVRELLDINAIISQGQQ